MCISASESCPYGTLWLSPTNQNALWVPPQDFDVFPDNKPMSTTLDYSNWKDDTNNKCSQNFCGTPTYSFLDATTLGPLPFASAVKTADDGLGTITFTVQTLNTALSGTYYVAVRAALA